MTVKLLLVKSENGLETRQDYDGLSANNPTFTGVLTGASAALTGGVDAGGEVKSGALAGTGARPVVALADGTIDDQDAAVFLGTIGALPTDSPDFSGPLKQGGTTRITSGGGGWFASMQSTNLVGAGDRPVAADLTGTLQPKTPDQFRNMISALASSLKGAANGVAELGADGRVPTTQLPSYFSKLEVSASTTIGSIDATAIKVTTTDVNLTLSGGVDGQGWDIINPTASTGIAIPSGATLWKSIGSDVGPTTIALGGGRPIRITRIDANTWIMLGSQ